MSPNRTYLGEWTRPGGNQRVREVTRNLTTKEFVNFIDEPSVVPSTVDGWSIYDVCVEVGQAGSGGSTKIQIRREKDTDNPTFSSCFDNGLIFQDWFTVSNRNIDGYNSWEESSPGSFSIVNEVVEADWTTKEERRMLRTVSLPSSFIVQANVIGGSNQTIAKLRVLVTGLSDITDSYLLNEKTNFDFRIAKAGGTILAGPSGTAQQALHGVRFVVDTTKDPVELRGYKATGLDSLQDTAEDFTLQVSATDSGSPNAGSMCGIEEGDGSNDGDSTFDGFLLFGRNIEIRGVPDGYKVQIDNRPAKAETNNVVRFDVDDWAMPATTAKLLDANDEVIDTIIPVDGLWGGTVFYIKDSSVDLLENPIELTEGQTQVCLEDVEESLSDCGIGEVSKGDTLTVRVVEEPEEPPKDIVVKLRYRQPRCGNCKRQF